MAYATTDIDVACTLSVQKTVNGENVPGYPKDYSILDSFGSYQAISVNAWQKLEYGARQQRIQAFKNYVNATEGVNVDADQLNDVYRASSQTPGIIVEY